jgi:xanthine dehydrogenase small subunit
MTSYARPRDIAEACALRGVHPDWMILAGGTDLMVEAPRKPIPPGILDLWRLPGLDGIRRDGDEIVIGAGATYREIGDHPLVREHLSPLALAAREVGALQIQARATIGGNIGTSSPVGDGLPALLALEAELEVMSAARGRRRVPYCDWCTGYRTTDLAADELIVAVHVPMPVRGTRLVWRKVGTRRAQSISKVMGAAAIMISDGAVRWARVAFGAVADRPIRMLAVEEAVRGMWLTRAGEVAREALTGAIHPITDVRSTADYRLLVAQNLVARFFA